MQIRITLLFITSISLSSCLEKTNFSDKDYEWTNVYIENDTLVFHEVKTFKKDTSIISKKEIFHAEFQPMSRGTLLPHTYKLFYWNRTYENLDYPYASLIEMYKDDDNVPASPWISYLGFLYHVEKNSKDIKSTTLESTGQKFEKVLILARERRASSRIKQRLQPKVLYWDMEYGIIKYETYGGEVWERININN